MKKSILLIVFCFGLAFIYSSCKKSTATSTPDEVSAEVKAIIKSHGFDVSDIQKIPEGYLVEKDIIYTEENLRLGLQNSGVPQEEQYRTASLVTGLPRTITIRLSSGINTSFWSTVLQNAVNRYNAVGLRLRFSVVSSTSSANITVYPISGTGGSAGFPSGGNPYSRINMGTGIASCGTNTATTVLAHEMGHCIGFRHTDWFNRSFSCGTGGSESSAIHIPGTPTTAVSGSWMLACYACGGNRPFVSSDVTALRALYN